ncbi:hypothetical protein D3C71_2197750 [compost metagenome]
MQFTLREHNSVPEKREQRLPKTPATVGQGTANATPAKTGSGPAASEQEQLSWVEQKIKAADKALGDILA